MELDQIREKINAVDDTMRQHFAERLDCSEAVAEAKLKMGDSVYKPKRERQVYARFPGDADEEKLYRLYVRKVMQLSRYHQYGIFLERGMEEAEFTLQYDAVKVSVQKVLKANVDAANKKAAVKIEVTPDPQAEQGMTIQDILSLLGDFGTDVIAVQYEGPQISVTMCIRTMEVLEAQRRLLYMLYKESMTYNMYVDK